MARSLYLYSPLSVNELEAFAKEFEESFEELLGDTFSDDELSRYEPLLDSMAAVSPQPMIPELSYDDFEAAPLEDANRRELFSHSKSSLCLENLPYLESHPFQVSYLHELLTRMGPVLIDKGQFDFLMSKEEYLAELKPLKSMDDLVPVEVTVVQPKSKSAPVDPIDFLVLDVYREIEKLKFSGNLYQALEGLQGQSEKVKILFFIMREEKLDSLSLFQKSGLKPKDFDDYLEKLKFYLRKYS